jgi:uncharacterized membrane protein
MDLCWIGFIASGLYRSQIGQFMNIVNDRAVVNVPAALGTWVLIVTGIQVFVLPRATQGSTVWAFLLWGALYGLVLYGVYDLTNFAVVKGWPLAITFVDMLWGGFACAMASLLMGMAGRAMGLLQ